MLLSYLPSKKKVVTRQNLQTFYTQVRQTTEFLCHPLEIEDYVVQPIEDVSPPKWHLAHTSWFFEANILKKFIPDFKSFDQTYNFLFNSYYESFGSRTPRKDRGVLSRPTVNKIMDYRQAVDREMENLIDMISEDQWVEFAELTTLGLNHEQQHQELLVTDIKYIFSVNSDVPVYNKSSQSFDKQKCPKVEKMNFLELGGSLVHIGWKKEDGFSYDNERSVHKVYIDRYKISDRLVTNGEFLAFMEDGGYENFRLWLSDGWDCVKKNQWDSPLFWKKKNGQWFVVTLNGLNPLNLDEPVCHVSYFEADAYAKWSKKRLPNEAEWENAVRTMKLDEQKGNFLEDNFFHPIPVTKSQETGPLKQMFGDVWEWTSSSYQAYPGFVPEKGALAEYNEKFMANQMVLRGGSCLTPRDHIRATYRNFFQTDKRWQVTGFRLASD